MNDFHPESLLHIPLVRHMLEDPAVALVPRATDEQWARRKLSLTNVVGFNPLHGAVYYPRRSALASWLEAPQQSARSLNHDDVLVHGVLFAAHDYLHAWACSAIRELRPELGLGQAPITADNFEDFVFCLLATEAVAVVGLDYWYLSTVDLNEVCPIGTTTRRVAVNYRESDLPEFRRFHPSFAVQAEDFFELLARFYMEGEFPGFGIDDLLASPLLMRWLSQEVLYGERQRIYMRQWCSFLSEDAIELQSDALSGPVAADAPWQRDLLRDLGAMLWDKVHNDVLHPLPSPLGAAACWSVPPHKPADFRFVNANRHRGTAVEYIEAGPHSQQNFEAYMDQFVSQHVFDHQAPWAEILAPVRQSRSTTLLQHVMRDVERVELGDDEEPMSLFFQG